MKCTIKVPHTLDLNQAVNFTVAADDIPEYDVYAIDYARLSTVRPFGMLLYGARLRQFMDQRGGTFEAWNFEGKDYAAHMGFFQSIGLDYGKHPGEAPGNANYIPITQITVPDLTATSLRNREHVGETIERESDNLARVLSRGQNNLTEHLTYAIREVVRNTVEHSDAGSVWVAGQYWPTLDLVEVAVLDEGIGIRRGLSRNRKLRVTSDVDALKLAVEPGISGTLPSARREDDMWANSGFGLYMTSNLCRLGGSFVLCSGGSALHLERSSSRILPCKYQGTAIRMRLRPSQLGALADISRALVREGERRARQNRKLAIVSASKVSAILVTRDE